MQTVRTYRKMKASGEQIVMITAYDYPSAKYVETAGCDIILVGDSLGMVVMGYPDTLSVTMADMVHHTKAVKRGAADTFIVADMPYMSYHINTDETKKNAARLILEAGAHAVKLEGGSESRLEMIRAIVDCEIPVVAHLGLTPQSINRFGGYHVQGKQPDDRKALLEQACQIEAAGAFMLVLECIPEALGKDISQKLTIPTIGIGAGRYTDGQVLVYHDILGMSDFKPKFVQNFANLGNDIISVLQEFTSHVKEKKFPAKENIYIPLDRKDN